jgi:hypothetical protein
MAALYFPKPQPLSPLSTARWRMDDDLRYYQVVKGKKRMVKGVELSESIYYWWFEYLKLSDKFQKLCGQDVVVESCTKKEYAQWKKEFGDTLLKDFGNIFEYENSKGFWQWWNEKGKHLFGINPLHGLDQFASVDEILEHRQLIDSGALKLVALPTTLTRATLQRRLAKLIDQMTLSGEDEQTAKYHPYSVKVDAESLCSAYQAYQLRKEGQSNVFIGAYFSLCTEQQREFLRDGRLRGKTFDYKAYETFVRKRRMTVEQADEANERQEVVFFMDSEKRTAKKNYLNVKASRLVAKAEDNIRAVEQQRFPVGTPEHLVKGSDKSK